MNKYSTFSKGWIDRLLNNTFLNKLKAVFGKTYFQTKTLSSDISATTSDIPDLRFNNLQSGKYYKLTMNVLAVVSADTARLKALHDSAFILRVEVTVPDTPTNDRGSGSASIVFKATSNTLTFNFDEIGSAFLEGDGSTYETFVMLEELPNHEETTKFD